VSRPRATRWMISAAVRRRSRFSTMAWRIHFSRRSAIAQSSPPCLLNHSSPLPPRCALPRRAAFSPARSPPRSPCLVCVPALSWFWPLLSRRGPGALPTLPGPCWTALLYGGLGSSGEPSEGLHSECSHCGAARVTGLQWPGAVPGRCGWPRAACGCCGWPAAVPGRSW